MNNRLKLIDVLEDYSQGLSIFDLTRAYSEKYHIANDGHFQHILKQVLENSKTLFRFNKVTKRWEKQNNNYLYVSDNRRFSKIRDAMFAVFAKKVNSGSAYFAIDDIHNAWFPQLHNDEWENVLSEDQCFWFERPKNNADYSVDNKLRYVFAREKDGYRFTGLFKFVKLREDKTRIYELIDDKVRIIAPKQSMLVCRIAWMKEYQGITATDTPVGGGSYVNNNNDAFEKYNFCVQEDGLVHGFVETKYSQGHTADIKYANSIHIEKLDFSANNSPKIDNVRVVFVSYNPEIQKTVIVGWYDNATVYRNRFEYNGFFTTMTCKKEDAHLIPVQERIFEIPKASKDKDYGIGQNNFWYIQSCNAANSLEEKIATYLDSMI